MKTAFPRSARSVSVYSQAGFRLAAYLVGRAERSEKAEGKIKETGTTLALFLKLLLSARWLGEPRAAPCFWSCSAALSGNTLPLLDFDRHQSLKLAAFRVFRPEARL